MEKRAIIAVVLSAAVFYLFSYFTGPQKAPEKPVASSAVASKQEEATATTPAVTASPSAVTPAKPAQAAQLVTVDTPQYVAVFSSTGASLKSLTLKAYKENNRAAAKQVILAENADPLLPVASTAGVGFNLSPQALYNVDAKKLSVTKGQRQQLIFTHVSSQGFVVRKAYSFDGSSYGIQLDTQLINNTQGTLSGAFRQIITSPYEFDKKISRYENYGSTVFGDNSLHTDAPKEFATASKRYEKSVQWSGITDKYFLVAMLSEKGSIANVEIKKNQAGFLESAATTPAFTVPPGQSASASLKLFVGPKDIDILKSQGSSLEQSLDLGWFTVLAKPMLHSLKFFYGYVHNYGLAIIIITIILKLLFFPLTHKSYKSMKQMGNLQPKMAALKEKYKNDRDAMNRAVMELYRDHKVNPLGGCLPMLVQIPVFFALYKALMFSIELRHAPFVLWITDLSDKDPYYVTPIIMGVTMFVQQKMTPSNMDEMQQKIMLMLPVVFTFMFLTFPSGLVLYWLVNNILTIGQQMYINKLTKD
jgi:YidC/Oxa1 family membrane protein insertase